ncbi:MAG: thiamine-phosphate kinase, partial [Acidimicrobiia bacterium]
MTLGSEGIGGRGGDGSRGGATAGERAFIEGLRRRLPGPPAGELWIGDDAAVLADGLLVATDLLVEGVHFDLAWCSGEDVGWKALAVNCSDLAAMGGIPRAGVVALAVGPVPGMAEEVMEGMAQGAEAFGCPVVGGDT